MRKCIGLKQLSETWSRGGRFAKAAAAKKYRAEAKAAAESAGIETGPWPLASVTASFFFACRRRRDQDNAMAMLKPAYDGLVDAGIVIDDDFDHLKREAPTFAVDADNPRVELVVTRLD
jgi:hypothetical protein